MTYAQTYTTLPESTVRVSFPTFLPSLSFTFLHSPSSFPFSSPSPFSRRHHPRLRLHGGGAPSLGDRFGRVVVEVQLAHVSAAHLRPPVFVDVVHGDGTAGEGVSEGGVIDGATSQLARVLHAQIPLVALVQNAVREQRPGTHAEALPLETRTVAVDVVQPRTVQVPTRHHRPHGQSLAAIAVQGVAQELRRPRDGDSLPVFELVQAALNACAQGAVRSTNAPLTLH